MNRLLQQLLPFLFLGMIIVMLIAGIVLLSYLLIFGALVGVVLYVVALIRDKFFSSKDLTVRSKRQNKTGRTIDHDDH